MSILLFETKEVMYTLDKNIELFYLPQIYFSKKELSAEQTGEKLFKFRVKGIKTFFKSTLFDKIISFEDYNNICTLTALQENSNVIVSSRVSIGNMYKNQMIHLMPYSFYVSNIKKLYKNIKVISVSQGVAEELKEYNIISKVIPNGIDIDKIKELSLVECDIKEPFLLHVGRFDTRQKGQKEALYAYSLIASKMKTKLVFIGDGKDKLHIQQEAERLKLEQRVIFKGYEQNPYCYMANCEAFLFPSVYEGLPNTFLEALSLNCKIISFKFIPSWREFAGYENVEFIDNDIEVLAQKIVDVLNQPNKKVKELNQRCINEFSLSQTFRKWENIILN
ncbi:glycosyltransferase [Candidatus Marinarcus aquaticus]|uniref:glycosyltransferase n=1 Tax=Candidatus Marinarcus aquaticus TaxID=2044504 RepID=UPI00100B46E6|nr:glycosyltransferase [Candidatus Marinarcus aquaticus]